MRRQFLYSLILVVGVLGGCTEQRLVDVSNQPKYAEVIGSTYVVIGAVDAYGIREHSNAEVEYITLIPRPEIRGPEVGFELPVVVGTKVVILNVMKSNRWPDADITLIVQIDGTVMPVQKKIRIDLFRGNEGQGRALLNPKNYRKLANAAQTKLRGQGRSIAELDAEVSERRRGLPSGPEKRG